MKSLSKIFLEMADEMWAADLEREPDGKSRKPLLTLIKDFNGLIVNPPRASRATRGVLTYLHGSCGEFDKFDITLGSKQDILSWMGFHFTKSEEVANHFANNKTKNCYIYTVGVNVKKLLKISETNLYLLYLAFHGYKGLEGYKDGNVYDIKTEFDYQLEEEMQDGSEMFVNALKQLGITGILYKNEIETSNDFDIIVFDNSQIKIIKKTPTKGKTQDSWLW